MPDSKSSADHPTFLNVIFLWYFSNDLFPIFSGTVVGGDPDKVMRVQYVWVFVRDQTELDPKAAWRLLEFGVMSANEQYL